MSATNRGRKRQSQDGYPTPAWCIWGMIDQLHRQRLQRLRVVDPACGDGRILKRLSMSRLHGGLPSLWIEFDLAQHPTKDYLTWNTRRLRKPIDLMVTNPPYSLAEAFIRKALEVDRVRALCLLLRLNFLGSKDRVQLWQEHPPRQLMVLTPRPCFVWVCRNKACKHYYPVGYEGVCDDCGGPVTAGSDASEYAWFWWGDPTLLWHPDQAFLWIERSKS